MAYILRLLVSSELGSIAGSSTQDITYTCFWWTKGKVPLKKIGATEMVTCSSWEFRSYHIVSRGL